MSFIAYLIAIVIFILVGLEVVILGAGGIQLAGWGLAFFALGHLLPTTIPSLNRE